MTASVLKQDPEKEMFFSRKIQCRLCVCVIINKRSFEPFMSFELQGALNARTGMFLSVGLHTSVNCLIMSRAA